MAIFGLVHGAGDGGWAWHPVVRALQDAGHDAVAPDLPTDRDGVTWDDCVDAVAAAVGGAVDDGGGLVMVGHSAGGFVVPLAAERLGAVLQVFVAGMVPRPGETAGDWFANVGWAGTIDPDPMVTYYEDVPAELAAEALARERSTDEGLGETPWPLPALPPVPARYVVTTRDRFLPPDLQRRVAAERLGLREPDHVDSGHCPNLSRPVELARLLVGFVDGGGRAGDHSRVESL